MIEHFIILLEQGIDEGNQASDYMANGFSLAFVGLRSLIISTKPGHQALVQTGPLCLALHCIPRDQIHHLLHLTRSPFRKTCSVKGNSCLCSLWCPSEVRLEMTGVFKVGNMANRRKDGCGVHGANWRNGEQNLSFSTVLNDLGYLHVQPLYVFLNETHFLDEQILFQQETLILPRFSGDPKEGI